MAGPGTLPYCGSARAGRSSTQEFAVVFPSSSEGYHPAGHSPLPAARPGWPPYDVNPELGAPSSYTPCNAAGGRTSSPWKDGLDGRSLQLQGRMVCRHPTLCLTDHRYQAHLRRRPGKRRVVEMTGGHPSHLRQPIPFLIRTHTSNTHFSVQSVAVTAWGGGATRGCVSPRSMQIQL